MPVTNSASETFCVVFQQQLTNVQRSQHFNNPYSGLLQQQPEYEIKALDTLISTYIILTTFAKDFNLPKTVNFCFLCHCVFCCARLYTVRQHQTCNINSKQTGGHKAHILKAITEIAAFIQSQIPALT